MVLLDARPGLATFNAGHLEGAVHADLNSQLSGAADPGFDPKHGGRHPLPPIERWTRLLGEWGIGPETPVVIYDEADGSNAAARAWWMLRAVGHTDVSVMDGGFRAAVARGDRVTTETPPVTPRDPYPADRWLLPTVDMNEVAQLQPGWKILDVRSAPRYRGETEPIDPIAGHIPGAVNLPFAENLDANGLFKSHSELRAQYEALLDGTPPERLIVHCGSGVTACHTLLALDLAGLPGASLYVGSWSEWCRNK
jgi:thiosulfate/3-mercaptopyruvate sulfurtransferase